MRHRPTAVLVLACLLAASSLGAAPPGTLAGRVVGVSDGDSLTLLTPAKTQIKIRLNGIDAPETGQPWGANAKRALGERVFDRTVSVRGDGRDRYGRTLGRVRTGGLDVNADMVEAGAAWAYRQYLTDDRFITLEREARAADRGLWALPADQTTAPWDWRAGKRADAAAKRAPPAATASSTSTAFSCGPKRYCSQMTSCAEARFHLRQCRVPTLDGDGDGTPCEAICRI